MATNPFDDMDMQGNQSEMTTPEPYQNHWTFAEDSSSASYIPRMARTVPHASTVHTIVRRSPTLWHHDSPNFGYLNALKMDLKTGAPSRPFWATSNLHKIIGPYALRRINGAFTIDEVPPISSSTTSTIHPVLPHPEHSNVYFGQPVSTIPDHTYILQSCWGRSAQHHSQGSPTSLYWPPWRSTPPSSPARTTMRPTTTNPLTSTSTIPPPGNTQHDQNALTDMSDSSV